MTSEPPTPRSAFVWTWLPGRTEPVVAGRVDAAGGELSFVYARSYRERGDAISLYPPELPIRSGRIRPLPGLAAPGCLLDARPDAWGQRVVLNRLTGRGWQDTDPGALGDLTYLLESGSNRVGALDFQASPTEYVARGAQSASLEELVTSAERVEAGVQLSAELDAALLHGSSIGGARPKATLRDGDRQLIAKFSSTRDTSAVVQGEFVGMRLAALAGIDVASVSLTSALGRAVLLVERFDRGLGDTRHHLVSALTLLQLDELAARHASYADLTHVIRRSFTAPQHTLRELFARITFNVLIGNTDDHARNHAALWDGDLLSISPAYDLCPQLRFGGEASQGMIIGADGYRLSQLSGCLARATEYGLSEPDARALIDHQIDVIESHFSDVCDEAELPDVERQLLHQRAVLLPYALEGYAR